MSYSGCPSLISWLSVQNRGLVAIVREIGEDSGVLNLSTESLKYIRVQVLLGYRYSCGALVGRRNSSVANRKHAFITS